MKKVCVLWSVLLAGCASSNTDKLPRFDHALAFICTHEVIPAASADSDALFQYARWLQKDNQLKRDHKINKEIERLYRIAAANGHFKASINLQNGGLRGEFVVPDQEYLRLSQELIEANVATGYYLVSMLLEYGAAGLEPDSDMSLRYLSKAANSGSAQAQFFLGSKLEASRVVTTTAYQMFRCAAEQGHGEAADALGTHLKIEGQYAEATTVFQMGVAAGNSTAAGRLNEAFRDPPSTNRLLYLAQVEDLERADRYENIWRTLHNYSYANPKVPEINDIVPLPPAKLPEWDGKLKWLEEREANIPPPKPSEELINKLADAAKFKRA